LIGADLLNLDKVAGLGAPIASIGGAGTFDGIFVTSIVAVLLGSLTTRHSRPNTVRIALRVLLGGDADRELNAFEAEEIWVEPRTARVNVSTDGEVNVMDAPLHYKIRPQALRVLVPR